MRPGEPQTSITALTVLAELLKAAGVVAEAALAAELEFPATYR